MCIRDSTWNLEVPFNFSSLINMNKLPYAAINLINAEAHDDVSFCSAAKRLVDGMIRRTRTCCAIQFLKCCLQAQVIPFFILGYFSALPEFDRNPHTQALTRKVKSTQLELIRYHVSQHERKNNELDASIGYDYLQVTRRGPIPLVENFLGTLERAVRREEQLVHHRHANKWQVLTSSPVYPCASYFFALQPRFPFHYVDGFWFAPRRSALRSHTYPNDNIQPQVTNDTEISLPNNVHDLLSKGPKFRVPPPLDDKFFDRLNQNLDTLTYKIRWQYHTKDKSSNSSLYIPFPRNTVNLPPPMPKILEDQLICLKNDIIRLTTEGTRKLQKDKKFNVLQKQVRATKSF